MFLKIAVLNGNVLQSSPKKVFVYAIKTRAETIFTLILQTPKVLAFAPSKEPGQPAHPCSLIRHYTVG